LVQTKTTLLNL